MTFLLQTRNPKYSRCSLIGISTMGRCFPSHSVREGKVIAYHRFFHCKRVTLSIAEEFPSTDKHLNNSQVPSLTACFLLVISFCIYLAELIKNVDVTPSFLAAFASDEASLDVDTANAQVVFTPCFPRSVPFRLYFHTTECSNSLAFCVYPSKHFPVAYACQIMHR